MASSPERLRLVAELCRDMAGSCYTAEAKEALLELSEELEDEADELLLSQPPGQAGPAQAPGGGRY